MKCFNCAFFTGNGNLLCTVNPSYCKIDAEPCKDFELNSTYSKLLVEVSILPVVADDYRLFIDKQGYPVLVSFNNQTTTIYDHRISLPKDIKFLQSLQHIEVVKEFLDYCPF